MSDALVPALGLATCILMSCAHVAPESRVSAPTRPQQEVSPYGLDLTLQDGQSEVALSSFAGRLVLLLISTPGCEACDRLKPGVKALATRLQSESVPVSFVSALLERPPEPALDSSERTVRWAEPRLAAGSTKLGVIDAVPLTWLLSRTGVPLLRYEGAADDVLGRLEEDLRGYLRVESEF